MAQTAELAPSRSRHDRGDAQLHRRRRQPRSSPSPPAPAAATCAPAARPIRAASRIHNGRPHAEGLRAGAQRLPLRAPRHQGRRFLRRGRNQARLLSGDGGADQSRERRQARRRVRPHAAHRRRRAARGEENPRSRAPRAQRLHRMVGTAARARYAARRGGRIVASAASPSSRCGGRSAIRSRPFRWRSATRERCRRTTW